MDHADGCGTFAYPDPSIGKDGPEEYLRHLWAMPISERMLSNADFLYEEWRHNEILRRLNAELHGRLAPGGDLHNAQEQFKKDTNGYWHERTLDTQIVAPAEAEARQRIAAGIGPAHMPRSQVATIVRAAQACRLTGLLPEGEDEPVYQHQVIVGDETITLLDLRHRYHAHEWIRDALVDSDLRVASAMNRAADAFLTRTS